MDRYPREASKAAVPAPPREAISLFFAILVGFIGRIQSDSAGFSRIERVAHLPAEFFHRGSFRPLPKFDWQSSLVHFRFPSFSFQRSG
jgi:hypothetical protein